MILQPGDKEVLIGHAVNMTNVWMKEVTNAPGGLCENGVLALEKFYDKLVELYHKDSKIKK